MEYGIALNSVIPLRAEPSHRAEMVTQLLFGETFSVIDTAPGGWFRVRVAFDGYEGWMDADQGFPIGVSEFTRLQEVVTPVSLDLIQLVADETRKSLIPVVIGSSLPGHNGSSFTISGDNFIHDGHVSGFPFNRHDPAGGDPIAISRQLLEDAMLYMNAPYCWGGRSPFGIDCSGFVQMTYKLQGISLRRDAHQQAAQGETISFLEESRPGDLAFFDNDEGRIIHVGILADHNRIIHCSGHVRIDTIDHEGIYRTDTGQYSHKLRLIRRII